MAIDGSKAQRRDGDWPGNPNKKSPGQLGRGSPTIVTLREWSAKGTTGTPQRNVRAKQTATAEGWVSELNRTMTQSATPQDGDGKRVPVGEQPGLFGTFLGLQYLAGLRSEQERG